MKPIKQYVESKLAISHEDEEGIEKHKKRMQSIDVTDAAMKRNSSSNQAFIIE